jgi:hypothetical protein
MPFRSAPQAYGNAWPAYQHEWRDELLAPDLIESFVDRYAYAKLSPDQKLDRLLDVLKSFEGAA